MWCDAIGHNQRDCVEFAEALKSNVIYLWNGRVHASDTWRALEMSIRRGRMKQFMEEVAACHVEAVHYSTSAGIRVENDEGRKTKHSGF